MKEIHGKEHKLSSLSLSELEIKRGQGGLLRGNVVLTLFRGPAVVGKSNLPLSFLSQEAQRTVQQLVELLEEEAAEFLFAGVSDKPDLESL